MKKLNLDRGRLVDTALFCSEQKSAEALRPGANCVPIPVVALGPDAEEHAQAEHPPVAEGRGFTDIQPPREETLTDRFH